ncbi:MULTISPECIES: hypothetical protein [Thermomonospora]|uniref:Serine/threonine protein kinase n=1 Tax=Thermomonospora curvata (strain ATCC 19995 / DSM 43183 / JCM 3096 / KCTC 9072 / NBRC 15933 / NCIMB 10081 / Henssen B9) TaxID=471852 RepID=D1A2Z7_THECD|nr:MULTISPECIES: hypothetical protein [Thermomonospora]ACY97945.1 hypothetical protein Tcur_2380 [Thermomonospora curvata DSM 43183]PKK14224.1 MAG: hypothetical protein BUE48_011645 [Thermomonospora sp. CIF 1]
MSRPLPSDDPAQLGPFRLSARLLETPAGIVFLGEDDQGRQATVAVLRQGAADDAAARDRFKAAILAAVPGGPDADGGAPIVAAQPEGPTPWVAVRYEPGASGGPRPAGAERFLEPVALTGRRRRGPGFVPYWAGRGGPAAAQAAPPAPRAPAPSGPRRLAAAVLALAVLLALLTLLMLMLFACRPQVTAPPPDPPADTMPSSQTPSPSPTPSSPSPTSPAPTSPSPGEPGGTGGPGGIGGDL